MEWEHKRGKWTKRWLELREHSMWISKKQGARDATVLCTLSNFDAYLVTRLHKSPRPFIFSMKSVQNMQLFERPQDYHHVFCCNPEEGRDWLQNILLARVGISSTAFNCTLTYVVICPTSRTCRSFPSIRPRQSLTPSGSQYNSAYSASATAQYRRLHISYCPKSTSRTVGNGRELPTDAGLATGKEGLSLFY